MSQGATSCSTCGDALVPDGAGSEAAVGTVRGTLDGPRRWRCPSGHEHRVINAEAARAEVLAALDLASRSRVRGTLRCGVCETPFALPGRRATRSVTLVASDVPATRLTFDIPVLRCTEDAVDNLPPECVADLEAVVDALVEGSDG